jgi:hypothetical protein
MWHLSLESGMFRLASVFALACLTLAATAILAAPKRLEEAQSPRENDDNGESRNRLATLGAERTVSFHARFSLN